MTDGRSVADVIGVLARCGLDLDSVATMTQLRERAVDERRLPTLVQKLMVDARKSISGRTDDEAVAIRVRAMFVADQKKVAAIADAEGLTELDVRAILAKQGISWRPPKTVGRMPRRRANHVAEAKLEDRIEAVRTAFLVDGRTLPAVVERRMRQAAAAQLEGSTTSE